MDKIKVGVIRGGVGKDYASSLEIGGNIISHIFEKMSQKYKVVDILIDKNGDWHANGLPINPHDLVYIVDLIWNVSKNLGNSFNLNNLSIPKINNNYFFSSLENDKEMLRRHVKQIGLDMPRSIVIPFYQKDFDGPREKYSIKKAKEVFEKFPSPWMVRSFTPDSNMGIHLAKTFPELVDAIEDGVVHGKSITVEEFIPGKVASVHSMPLFRNHSDIYTFPIGNTFGSLSFENKEKLSSLSKKLHKHLGANHYLKCDFVLNKRGKIYLLNIEGSPDFKKDSHFYQSCESVGAEMSNIISHILEKTFNKELI